MPAEPSTAAAATFSCARAAQIETRRHSGDMLYTALHFHSNVSGFSNPTGQSAGVLVTFAASETLVSVLFSTVAA